MKHDPGKMTVLPVKTRNNIRHGFGIYKIMSGRFYEPAGNLDAERSSALAENIFEL